MLIFQGSLKVKNKEIPRIILGFAPFTGESYFGHRSRLYQLDLHAKPEEIANIIKKANDIGINAINLINDSYLLEAFGQFEAFKESELFEETNLQENRMEVIATIGKSNVNYVFPDFEKAKEANWKEDIKLLSKFNTPIMLIDEFITDSYDWELLENILSEIKKQGSLAGLITSFPFKTTKKLLDSPILKMFDFYMVPVNKLGYMMDSESFMDKERKELARLLNKIDKKIIVNKILACGIQQPEEAFKFLKTLDYVDMVTFGVANTKELELDFKILTEL
ncbi:hypothetical protein MBCUT_05260 [Methanobrevibacter cuticularis]|uniref:Uncharacterized protein n=1 Tax=Methanobrevibacter cuticularis TaxID=47311 RepID=A0A166CU16_9EURY|nr:hypothetical protein [Methanobrevibacter cuticularis]KZX16807.1 hypothetical protein MBCUT_05260 [Methanobrevibacter cuticularis]